MGATMPAPGVAQRRWDFSGIRVHTDPAAAASARAIGALAYTAGSDIVFGEGQYAPETTAGRRLLAHELVHTVQGHPRVRRTPDAATLQLYDTRAAAIRAHAAYRALP